MAVLGCSALLATRWIGALYTTPQGPDGFRFKGLGFRGLGSRWEFVYGVNLRNPHSWVHPSLLA